MSTPFGLSDAAGLREALDAGATLPADWYSDPAILRLEKERIFGRAWQYAGRADLVAEPGSYLTSFAGHIPVVVVRDRGETLRGLVNVCRHRGHIVAEGAGRRNALQCPYHAWTYDLDGTLRAAPRSEREPGFDPGCYSLLPVSVATWGPLVFVNPDPDAAPLEEALGPLPGLVAESGVELDRLRFRPVRESAGGNGGGAASGQTTQYPLLWPSSTLNIHPGPGNLSVDETRPDGPERSAGFTEYFFYEEVPDETAAQMIEFATQVA